MNLSLRETCLALGVAVLPSNCHEPRENPGKPEETDSAVVAAPSPSREETARELCRQYALNIAQSVSRQLAETGALVTGPVIKIKQSAEEQCLRQNGVPAPPPFFERSPSGNGLINNL